MEQLVLGVLEFNVSVPTAFFFANHFAKVSKWVNFKKARKGKL